MYNTRSKTKSKDKTDVLDLRGRQIPKPMLPEKRPQKTIAERKTKKSKPTGQAKPKAVLDQGGSHCGQGGVQDDSQQAFEPPEAHPPSVVHHEPQAEEVAQDEGSCFVKLDNQAARDAMEVDDDSRNAGVLDEERSRCGEEDVEDDIREVPFRDLTEENLERFKAWQQEKCAVLPPASSFRVPGTRVGKEEEGTLESGKKTRKEEEQAPIGVIYESDKNVSWCRVSVDDPSNCDTFQQSIKTLTETEREKLFVPNTNVKGELQGCLNKRDLFEFELRAAKNSRDNACTEGAYTDETSEYELKSKPLMGIEMASHHLNPTQLQRFKKWWEGFEGDTPEMSMEEWQEQCPVLQEGLSSKVPGTDVGIGRPFPTTNEVWMDFYSNPADGGPRPNKSVPVPKETKAEKSERLEKFGKRVNEYRNNVEQKVVKLKELTRLVLLPNIEEKIQILLSIFDDVNATREDKYSVIDYFNTICLDLKKQLPKMFDYVTSGEESLQEMISDILESLSEEREYPSNGMTFKEIRKALTLLLQFDEDHFGTIWCGHLCMEDKLDELQGDAWQDEGMKKMMRRIIGPENTWHKDKNGNLVMPPVPLEEWFKFIPKQLPERPPQDAAATSSDNLDFLFEGYWHVITILVQFLLNVDRLKNDELAKMPKILQAFKNLTYGTENAEANAQISEDMDELLRGLRKKIQHLKACFTLGGNTWEEVVTVLHEYNALYEEIADATMATTPDRTIPLQAERWNYVWGDLKENSAQGRGARSP